MVMLPIRVILHPTDFSARSRSAFRLAQALARDHGARLLVVHVGMPLVVFGEGVLPVDDETNTLALRRQLGEVRASAPEVRLERRLILAEDPARAIVRLAAEEPCDLIVMGTHGRTGLRRALLGSFAEQVMRKAPCPVLTVRVPFPVAEAGEVTTPVAEPVGAAR
jgi:nucleotide-binding universal stress UspA family protein